MLGAMASLQGATNRAAALALPLLAAGLAPRYTAPMSNFKPKGDNPFAPGAGLPPPLLAGRDEDIAFFKSRLARVKAHGHGDALAVYGPRGMGKTVLMRQLRDDFQQDGVHAVWATPEDGLVAAESLKELLPKGFKMGQLEVSASTGPLTELAGALKATWRSDKGEEARFISLLEEACKKAPRALFLDEAHMLDQQEVRRLLNMMQEVMYDCRFMLILIGTPGLTQSVRRGGTFGERFEYYSIDMLADEPAMEALRVPLGQGGISTSDELLQEAVRDAQRYPFFIQVWGEALWDHAAKQGIQQLGGEHLQAAQLAAERRRSSLYARRMKELVKDDALFAAAVAVADAFASGAPCDDFAFLDIIGMALRQSIPDEKARRQEAMLLIERLVELGYVWEPDDLPPYQAGIPSLMTYIAERRPEEQPEVPAADLQRIGAAAAKRLGA